MGCWTPVERFGTGDWEARAIAPDGALSRCTTKDHPQGRAEWPQLGLHNVHNALAALAAARHVGVAMTTALAALADFQGIKRRLENARHGQRRDGLRRFRPPPHRDCDHAGRAARSGR